MMNSASLVLLPLIALGPARSSRLRKKLTPYVVDKLSAASTQALKNGQIDGLVVDLPTAFYVTAAQFTEGVIAGQFPAPEGGEHFSVVLDKDSPLTPCVNAALGRLKDGGTLAAITQEWLADKANAPVFQP